MKLLKSLMKVFYRFIFIIIGHLPRDSNLVIFESFLGKQYSDNPRAIYEYLKAHAPDYQLVWSVDSNRTAPFVQQGIPFVKRFSLKWMLLLPRARFWVFNSRTPKWLPKPSHTTYLQTWHGTPLKKLGLDIGDVHMPGVSTEQYKKDFYEDTRSWDLLVSPNAYSSAIFRRAFHFEKEMIETGYPRNDDLMNKNNPETIETIKASLHLPTNKTIILYAPTWRDNEFNDDGNYTLDIQLDLMAMKEALGHECIVILRLHYLVARQVDLKDSRDFVYDLSDYEDIRDLYLISDILITDYSSVFFDYGNLKRPMIFFTYDLDTYRETLRGFYFDFEKEAPGPIVKTTEGVIQAIESFIYQNAPLPDKFYDFYDKFCYLETGESAKKIVEKVFSK